MKDVVIVGFGGFGREVAWLAEECGRNVRGFLDDSIEPGKYGAHRVLGGIEHSSKIDNVELVVAVGNPRTRKLIVNKLLEFGEPTFTSLVHPAVRVSSSVVIGSGSIVCEGAKLTVDIDISDHVILNLNVTVGHDSRLQSFVTVAPMVALSGNVVLEAGVEVGTAAAIRQGVVMSSGSMLGMGGVLVKNTEANQIYIGSPAVSVKELPDF